MSKPKPVTVGDEVFPSKSALARAKGVTVRAVTKAMKAGTLTTLGLGNKISMKVGDKLYESIAAAGRAEGLTRQAMWNRFNKELGEH